ncbi:MAG: putative Ig domain-containing protein [Magnetococcales bacterium]|nr:putative Ig domain-containing protein [Magnetococcales bacterium]
MIRSLPVADSLINPPEPQEKETVIHASAAINTLLLPDASFLLQGEYTRDGYDLVITNPAGEVIRIEGYFAFSHPPLLVLANGAALTFETVKALSLSDNAPVLVAGPGVPTGGEAGPVVGKVESLVGTVEAKGKDGVVRTLHDGDPVQEGDQITTGEKSLAKFVLQDGSVFQLGESSRALVDQYVFIPEEAKGQFAATVLTGSFRFASGQIGKLHDGKHTLIKTPTAEIGVRGSELLGEVVTDGTTTVVHNAGILDIADVLGRGVVTLLKPGTATAVHFGGGAPDPIFQAPEQLLQRLNSQVSDQAVIRAKEVEHNTPHTDPTQGQIHTPGTDAHTTATNTNHNATEIPWNALQSHVQKGEVYTVAESSLAAVTAIDPANMIGNGHAFTNGNLLFTVNKYDITVTKINHAPILPIVANQSVQEKGTLIVNLPKWSDPDGDAVTLSAHLLGGKNLPSWLTFDPMTGQFSGKPGSGDVGKLAIDVEAKDSLSASTHQVFTLDVTNVNDSPVVANAVAKTIPLVGRTVELGGKSFSFQLPSDTFTDPDKSVDLAEKIVLSASLVDGAGNSQVLPTWMIFDPATGALTVSGLASVGNYNVRVTATDVAGLYASDTFLISVRNAGTPYTHVEQGFFVDSAVGGATYYSGGIKGTTDSRGGFYYTPGEKIIFSLGELVLGEVKTSETATTTVMVTPRDLAQNDTVETNLLRLLQTLDSDGNPDNGITLTAETVNRVDDLQIDFSRPTTEFAANSQLTAFLAETGKNLVSAEAAQAHFQKTLELGITPPTSENPRLDAMQDQPFHTVIPKGIFTDPNNDTLTFTTNPLPEWLSFNPETLVFSGTPGSLDVTTQTIRLAATNTIEYRRMVVGGQCQGEIARGRCPCQIRGCDAHANGFIDSIGGSPGKTSGWGVKGQPFGQRRAEGQKIFRVWILERIRW